MVALMPGDKNNAQPEAQSQPLHYTKRRHFLFFKIKSKPVYQQQERGGAERQVRKRRGGMTLYEWIIALAAAAAVAVYIKPLGATVLEAGAAAVTVYVVIFGTFSLMEARRARRAEMIYRIKTGAPLMQETKKQKGVEKAAVHVGRKAVVGEKPKGPLTAYIKNTIARRKNLEMELREVGIKQSPEEFVRRIIIYAALTSAVIAVLIGWLLYHFGVPPAELILAPLAGIAAYSVVFSRYMMYPAQRSRVIGKQVESDILFAARDMVIGMRSGMPLYNALATVSTGYGAASKEFGKIIELVQLGLPIEQAMEDISTKSESRTFKRLMLQASVSIKAGVDVTNALQEVVDDVMQERVIDLRRYGQKLNALAMFYMLFGVIFPSMGIAVATIMSTFINIFPITYVVLVMALVFIAFVQIILLNIMRNSRPIFAM